MAKLTPRGMMKEAGLSLEEIMAEHLTEISAGMIKQIMSRARASTPSTRVNAISGEIAWPGEASFREDIFTALTLLSVDAIKAARKEVPRSSAIKFVDDDEGIQLSATTVLFDKLPFKLRTFITKNASMLVDTQLADLEKNLKFQYMDSYDTTDDMDVLEDDLRQVCVEYIEGSSVRGGSQLASAKTVNEARSAFFFEEDTLEELDAFEFVNGDPVTAICQDLAGTIFAKDDPNMFRYTPPLHWNCKSYIQPVLKGKLGGREIEKLKPSTKKLEDQIQFGEGCSCGQC